MSNLETPDAKHNAWPAGLTLKFRQYWSLMELRSELDRLDDPFIAEDLHVVIGLGRWFSGNLPGLARRTHRGDCLTFLTCSGHLPGVIETYEEEGKSWNRIAIRQVDVGALTSFSLDGISSSGCVIFPPA